MARVGPSDLNVVEVHDCFSISELIAYEVLGLAAAGEGVKLLESGATTLPAVRERVGVGASDHSIPVNAGGGLMGDGHPVGATGVRQAVDAYRQLTGQAGAMQVPGAKRVLTMNVGGSMTTSVVMVWGAEA